MGRAPCCEKMGLKKGPWTPEEDQILTSFIQLHGHSNWRALPKQAGLLRCGKSCRLRWVNYLKPDIKRGNFTLEEEEAIIKLHELLGNRWSAIAARLPGRTDNEIKNVWHTHLKKRLSNHQINQEKKKKPRKNQITKQKMKNVPNAFVTAESPQQSTATTTTTNTTTTTTTTTTNNSTEISGVMEASSTQSFPVIDESFWSDDLTIDDFEMISTIDIDINFDQSKETGFNLEQDGFADSEMNFWYDVFVRNGGAPELPDF